MTNEEFDAVKTLYNDLMNQAEPLNEKMVAYKDLKHKRHILEDILAEVLKLSTTHVVIKLGRSSYGVDFPNQESKQWLVDLLEVDIAKVDEEIAKL